MARTTPTGACKRCGAAGFLRPRGLCNSCYELPEVREATPIADIDYNRGYTKAEPKNWGTCQTCGGVIAGAKNPGDKRCSTCVGPEQFRPVVFARIAKYQARLAAGLPLFTPDDLAERDARE